MKNPVLDFFNRFGGSGLRLASYFDGGPLGTPSRLTRYQQPKESIVSNTSVADECCKTYTALSLVYVLLNPRLTTLPAIGRQAGAGVCSCMVTSAATTDRAVAQRYDADFAAFKAVQSLRLSYVKPVPNASVSGS